MATNTAGHLLKNLRALFAAHRISHNQFAKRTRISQTTISGLMRALENGRSPRLETLEAVARGFKVTVPQLMAPNLNVDGVDLLTPNRVLSRQLGRLAEDFLSSDDAGRQEILATAEAQALRSLKGTK